MGESQRDKFIGISCPTALILGEHSSDSGAQSASYIDQISNGLLPMFVIPATHHHFMFDEPMATVTAIKAILLGWRREANADELTGLFRAMLEE
jgi:pimeloyl-ACP methyl ester carboxylesterase